MRSRKFIAFTLLLLFSIQVRAQLSREWWKDYRYGIHAACSWQQSSSVEIGIHRLWRSNPPLDRRSYNWDGTGDDAASKWSPLGFWSTGAALEVPLNAGEFIAGPKLYSELNISLLSLSLSTTAYTNFHQLDMRLSAGAGISLAGIAGIRYERSISFTENSFQSMGRNRISLFVNFMKGDFPAY